MSVLPKHSNNNIQAVRVILSQLYIIWATDADSTRRIHETIQSSLIDAKATVPDAAVANDGSPVASNRVAGNTALVVGHSGGHGLVNGGKGTLATPRNAAVYGKESTVRDEHGPTPCHADPMGNHDNDPSHYAAATPDSALGVQESGGGSSPMDSIATSRRSISPAATPPSRSSYLRPDEARAFVQPVGGFLGVDEIDYANSQHNLHHALMHRVGSAGSSSSLSPPGGVRPSAVDPHAPLPHAGGIGSSVSMSATPLEKVDGASLLSSHAGMSISSSAHSSSGGGGGATEDGGGEHGWNGVARDEGSAYGRLTVSNHASLLPRTSRLGGGGGGGATTSEEGGVCAEEDDIPTFYTNELSRGVTSAFNENEYMTLKELLAELSSTTTLTSAENGTVEGSAATVVRKTQFGDISLAVFKVATWLKDLLFEVIALHAGMPRNTETLPVADVMRFYEEVFGKLSSTRRLFELIRGTECGKGDATPTSNTLSTANGSGSDNNNNTNGDKNTTVKESGTGRAACDGGLGVPLSSEYIDLEQLKSMTAYLVATHPGLEFLKQPEFQEYYCRTVAIRIMYSLERQQCGKIYWRDFDRSNLPDKIMILDTMDVNQVLEYFSYEHFYVLYCKFWELDTDRDLLVDFDDMCNYGQASIVPSVIRRVVDGYGRRLSSNSPGHLNYEDFVYFCLSEEDKNTDAAVLYWFKILDVDSDGILSGYELNLFYRENHQRFLEYNDGVESEVAYEDAMCQMLDLLGFARVQLHRRGVTLADLRSCLTPANFFNMIFNAGKFMLFEHRDPFAEHQQRLWPEKTDWDRFARTEYDRMASEAQ